jgi:hypothetical protein
VKLLLTPNEQPRGDVDAVGQPERAARPYKYLAPHFLLAALLLGK